MKEKKYFDYEDLYYEDLLKLLNKNMITEAEITELFMNSNIEKEELLLLICEGKLPLRVLAEAPLDYDDLYDLIDASVIADKDIVRMLAASRVKKSDVIKLICDDMLSMKALGNSPLNYSDIYELVSCCVLDEEALERLLDSNRITEDDIARLLDEGMIDDENLAYMY